MKTQVEMYADALHASGVLSDTQRILFIDSCRNQALLDTLERMQQETEREARKRAIPWYRLIFKDEYGMWRI